MGAFGFSIVMGIFLLGLFILLIVPGIIFSIYWIFSYYVFLNERKGIFASLGQSRQIVKGKWWTMLGYFILIILIVIGISIIFSMPSWITGIILAMQTLAGNVSKSLLTFQSILTQILSIAASFVTTPLVILFFKNLYLELKKK